MEAPTLAIDFGTTRTKVAFFDAASGRPRLVELGKEVRAVIPSVFYIPKEGDGERRVGDDALERIDSDPAGIVISLKKEIHKLGKKRCGPDRPAIERVRLASEMFAYIRRRCREEVFHGEDLLNCCLTVPVNFLDQQRQAIREAAQMGGFKEVTTMEEPVAAAYAWLSGHGDPKFGASVMVCDVGGGTTDFAFLRQTEGRFVADDRVLSSGFPEGGDDLDELIWQQASGQDSAPVDSNLKATFLIRIRRERELLPKSKIAKVEIKVNGQAWMLSRDIVLEATKEFVDKVQAEAGRFLEKIREQAKVSEVPILMVGGASRLPGMKEALETLNAGEVYLWNDSDYATVLGAVPLPDAAKSATAEASPEKIALFRQALAMAAADGKITHEEVAQLKRLVCDLRLTREIIVDEVSKCLKTGKVENRKDELIQSLCAVAATEPSATQATCLECGATMLAATAARTGGFCMACKQGIRSNIEASKSASASRALEHEQLCKSAERGDAEAQHLLGRRLIYGIIGVQANPADGFRWIKRAAEQAHAQAENDIGCCLQNGIGIQPDAQEAVRWYRKSAAQECPDGLLNLALCYHAGVGVEQDRWEAIWLLRKGAGLGHLDSMVQLGIVLCQDSTAPAKTSEAVQWFQRAAEQKHPAAIFWLGCCHFGGTGVSKDEATGFSLVQEAAELGWSPAQSFIGNCWLNGKYFPVNYFEAVKWFRKAADQRDYDGQVGLGKCYLNGWGVARDVRMAAKYLELAANANHPEAMTNLGKCYETGEL